MKPKNYLREDATEEEYELENDFDILDYDDCELLEPFGSFNPFGMWPDDDYGAEDLLEEDYADTEPILYNEDYL